jgi:hypothetical protein
LDNETRHSTARASSHQGDGYRTLLVPGERSPRAPKPYDFSRKHTIRFDARVRAAAEVLTMCAMLGSSNSDAKAQESLLTCEECEALGFEARYAPRPVALVAKMSADPTTFRRLWYLTDSHNAGLGVLSWNSHGQIVGSRFRYTSAATSTVPRAFLWLPQAQYNLAAGAPHDLFELAHATESATPSFAWDISEDGLVVGGAGALAKVEGQTARAWNLQLLPPAPTSPPSTFETNFDTNALEWSMALAVTPLSDLPHTPRMVGCGPGICPKWREPFEFFSGTTPFAAMIPHCDPPPSTMVPPLLYDIAQREWACDIASGESDPVGSYDEPRVVGGSDPCGSFCPICDYECNGPMVVGAHFPTASPASEFYRVASSLPSGIPSTDQPTGIRSSSGAIYGGSDELPILAGYHITRTARTGPCTQMAALWTFDTTYPLRNELPSVLARAGAGEFAEPIAQRWRKFECPCPSEVVVGWNSGLVAGSSSAGNGLGALWTTSLDPNLLGEFQSHSAAELMAGFGEQSNVNVSVEQLYDILPTGEILALVRRELPGCNADLFACILGLRGDLTLDHEVNAADLAVLLGYWGGPFEGDAPQVVADLNWDKLVDATDLVLLLDWWTGTPMRLLLPADGVVATLANTEVAGKSICMRLPGEDCELIAANLSMDSAYIQECLHCAVAVFGFEHPDAFAAWLVVTPPESSESVCQCVSAIMQNMMEDHSHE